MSGRLRSAALMLVFSLITLPGVAQEKGSVVTEAARVVVIEVPVNVIGKDGNPVRGLTREDFELFDDNKKQTLSGFEVIDLNAVAAPTAANPFPEGPPPAAQRNFFLVFDLSYSSATGVLRAREGAKAFVTTGLRPTDQAAVATYSIENGWKLLVNFTDDKKQLASAIEKLGLKSITANDPLSFIVIPPSEALGPAGAAERSGGIDAGAELQELKTLQKVASDDLARGRVAELLRSFSVMGRALDSIRGRKHIVYFSEGFDSRLVAGSSGAQAREDNAFTQSEPTTNIAAEAAISGETWKIDSDSRFGSSATRGRLTEALAVFNRSDSVVHTVDITGLSAEGDVVEKKASGKDALFTIASTTGGEFIRNANELGSQLQQLQERTGVIYLLAYQPKKLEKPGQFHNLRVKVKASGARVAARSGYYEPKPYRALSPIEKVFSTGDLVTGGTQHQDIPARLLTAPFAAEGSLAQVPVILEIPGKALLAGAADGQIGIEIYAYASDAKGTMTDYLTQTMALDLSKVRQQLEAGGIKFYGTLYLPPGSYTVRTLVRNATTGLAGGETATIEVPAMPGGEATVLPPVFAEDPGRWIMVKGNPRPGAKIPAAEYPFAVAGEALIPSALPALANGKAAQVAVFTYNFSGGAKPAPLVVSAQIVGPDGQSRPAGLQMSKQSDVERGGGRKVLYTFKPEGLAPGRYALKIAVSDPTGQKKDESFSPFEVR